MVEVPVTLTAGLLPLTCNVAVEVTVNVPEDKVCDVVTVPVSVPPAAALTGTPVRKNANETKRRKEMKFFTRTY